MHSPSAGLLTLFTTPLSYSVSICNMVFFSALESGLWAHKSVVQQYFLNDFWNRDHA